MKNLVIMRAEMGFALILFSLFYAPAPCGACSLFVRPGGVNMRGMGGTGKPVPYVGCFRYIPRWLFSFRRVRACPYRFIPARPAIAPCAA